MPVCCFSRFLDIICFKQNVILFILNLCFSKCCNLPWLWGIKIQQTNKQTKYAVQKQLQQTDKNPPSSLSSFFPPTRINGQKEKNQNITCRAIGNIDSDTVTGYPTSWNKLKQACPTICIKLILTILAFLLQNLVPKILNFLNYTNTDSLLPEKLILYWLDWEQKQKQHVGR